MSIGPTLDECLWCGESLFYEGSRLGNRFCSRKCKNAEWYQRKGIPTHRRRYEKSKQRWKVHEFGKKGGISMFYWWNKLREYSK